MNRVSNYLFMHSKYDKDTVTALYRDMNMEMGRIVGPLLFHFPFILVMY